MNGEKGTDEVDVKYCSDLIDIVLQLPTLNKLRKLYVIGSYEHPKQQGVLFIGSDGISEKELDIDADRTLIPREGLEAAIKKYSVKPDELSAVLGKVKDDLEEP